MNLGKRTYSVVGLAAIVAVAIVASTVAFRGGDTGRVGPGEIDDGAELLSQATISLAEAITAAQAVYSGALGEVDIEKYKGQLVFNIDIGPKDVKVDASDGTVLGFAEDDHGDNDA